MALRVLTFNWHESYLQLLSKIGFEMEVVEKWKAGVYGWMHAIRPVPPNCLLISEAEATKKLRRGNHYDRIIAHNLDDLLFVRPWSTPKVMVFHNKLTTEIALSRRSIDRQEYIEKVARFLQGTKNLALVFISESKRADWGLAGEVLPPGIDPVDYGGYEGDLAKVLRVGNGLRVRDVMLGYSLQERILQGLPSTILGLNPDIPNCHMPADWDEYRERMRKHRVYLNTTRDPFEDGYNLAMLEAMATGMPVVSLANPSSPIEDGVNGFVSEDETALRDGIEILLGDRSRAVSMGRSARESVLDRFPMGRFVENWKRILEFTSTGKTMRNREDEPRLKILMSYAANPQTTAAFLEKALRRRHEVLTYGPVITEEILRAWDLEKIRDRVRQHDVPYFTDDLPEVLRRLPDGWKPDLFLWVETGVTYPLKGFEALPCPSACYLIDTHLHEAAHLETAKRFQHVFLAQKRYVSRFEQAGIGNVHWLPLACDPEVHRRHEGSKVHEVTFVGSVTPFQAKRNRLLLGLAERFPVFVDRCFLEEMGRIFSRSKIVFNCSVQDDLNMRVFEAMATGSLLITDEAKGSGLTELFEDGTHLVLYRDERELWERVEGLLENEEVREQIAAQGREEVLSKHTYDHRVQEMLKVVCSGRKGRGDRQVGAAPLQDGDRESEGSEVAVCAIRPELASYYRKERAEVAALVPAEALRILDIGCGGGHLGKLLKEQVASREVWGVEMNREASEEAEKWLDHVNVADACLWDPPVEKGYFDAIVFADVLEHLADPQTVLERYIPWLKPQGVVILSIPNVRFWAVVKHLTEGCWTYQEEGILDRRHLRFFTWREAKRLLEGCGLDPEVVHGNLDPRCPPVPPGKTVDLDLGRLTIRGLGAQEIQEFFVFQYLVRAARNREGLLAEARLLEAAGKRSEAFRLWVFLVNRHPNDAVLLKKMLQAGQSEAETEEALQILEESLRLHPANLDLLGIAARAFLEEKRYEKAEECLERILLFDAADLDALGLQHRLRKIRVSSGQRSLAVLSRVEDGDQPQLP